MDGWEVLLLSLGWVLVFEGISPLIAPERWLAMLAELTKADPRAVSYTHLTLPTKSSV